MKVSTMKRTSERPSVTILRAGSLALLITTLLLSSAPLLAQTEDQIRIPRLAGHTFVPNPFAPDPFIKTYVRNSVGIGKVPDLVTPIIVIEGDTVVGLQGDLLNAILEFEYQQAIQDWVAFRAQIRVSGRLGTGVQSLLAQGITANTGFEIGWLFKLAQGRRTMLSGTLNLWNNSTTLVNLLDWVEGIVDGVQVPLTRTVPSTRGGGGLRFAWAVSDLVGVNLLTEVGYGESVDHLNDDEWFYKLAATVDFDLKTKTSVPLGFAVGYRQLSVAEGGQDISGNISEVLLRIAYTGSMDFRISLDMIWGQLPVTAQDQTLNVVSTLINLRYYF
jgi:hypothetical protein